MSFIATMESLTATGTATLTNKTINFNANTVTTNYQITQYLPSDPVGTAAPSYVMAGLAIAFTPAYSGKVKVSAQVTLANNNVAGGAVAILQYGTGTAPSNGAARTGTALGKGVNSTSGFTTGFETTGVIGYVSNLTVSTAYWFDFGQAANNAGTTNLYNIVFIIEEILK